MDLISICVELHAEDVNESNKYVEESARQSARGCVCVCERDKERERKEKSAETSGIMRFNERHFHRAHLDTEISIFLRFRN